MKVTLLRLGAILLLITGLVIEAIPVRAAIGYRATSTASTSGATSLTVSPPAGVLADDVMVAVISVRGGNEVSIQAPSGWTFVNESNSGTLPVLQSRTYYKIATSTETDYVFSFFEIVGLETVASSQKAAAVISAYSGVDKNSPIHADSSQINASNTSLEAPSVTTTVSNTWIIAAYSTAVGATFTAGSGMNLRGQIIGSGGGPTSRIASGLQDVAFASSGATGLKYITADSAAVNIGHTIALKPDLLTISQSSYRVLSVNSSGDVTGAYASTSTPADVEMNSAFSLRTRLSADGDTLSQSTGSFKMQYAEKTTTCGTYSDIEPSAGTPGSSYSTPSSATNEVNYSPIQTSHAWDKPSDATGACDEVLASAGSGFVYSMQTDYLMLEGFNFNIPANATITGIAAGVSGYLSRMDYTNTTGSGRTGLVVGGARAGTMKIHDVNQTLMGAPVGTSLGGSSDMWGTTLTPADVNAADFGIYFYVYMANKLYGDYMSAYIDCAAITVYYQEDNGAPIAYDSSSPESHGSQITSSAYDPSSARPVAYQSYVKQSPFTNIQSISDGSDGLWDIRLRAGSVETPTTYCIKAVYSNGSDLDYVPYVAEVTVVQELISTAPTLEEQLRGGQAVREGESDTPLVSES